jgi:cell division septum initiation protein DivIVA
MSIVDDINAISDRVLALEQENEQLRQQLASSGNTEAYDKLIDLITPDIEWKEQNLGDRASDRMKEIIAAYRAVRPK